MYKPKMYVKDVLSINYKLLKDKGIKCLLFDIDNTIACVNDKEVTKDIIELFNNLSIDFKVIIVSNAFKKRALLFSKILNVDVYPFACKPLRRTYLKVLKDYMYKMDEIAAIGDQVYTDIKGANRMGILSILVDPLGSKESIITKYNRLKEKCFVINKGIIRKGEYYE